MTFVCPCQGVCSSVFCINIAPNEVYAYTGGTPGTGVTVQDEHITDLRSSINDEYVRRSIAPAVWTTPTTPGSSLVQNEAVNELIYSLNANITSTGISAQLDGSKVNANVLLQIRNFIDYYRSLCINNFCSAVTVCSCYGGYCACVDNCTNVSY